MIRLRQWPLVTLLLIALLGVFTQPAAAASLGVSFSMNMSGGVTVQACGEAKTWWIEMKELQPNPRYIKTLNPGRLSGCVTPAKPVIWLDDHDVVQLAVGAGEYPSTMKDGSIYGTRYYQITRNGGVIDVQLTRDTPDLPPQPEIRKVWFHWSDKYNGSIVIGYDMTCYSSHGFDAFEEIPNSHQLGEWSWGALNGTSERYGATGIRPDLAKGGFSRLWFHVHCDDTSSGTYIVTISPNSRNPNKPIVTSGEMRE